MNNCCTHSIFKCVILVLLLGFTLNKGISQSVQNKTPILSYYGTSNGLPSNEIDFIGQDYFGRIWSVCKNKIVSFDGGQFKNELEDVAFADIDAFHIADSVFAFSTANSKMFFYNVETQQLKEYFEDERNMHINAILYLAPTVLYGTEKGVFSANLKMKSPKLKLFGDTSGKPITSMCPVAGSKIVFGSNSGYMWISELSGGKIIDTLKLNDKIIGFSKRTDLSLYVATTTEIYTLQLSSNGEIDNISKVNLYLPNSQISSIKFSNGSQKLYVGTLNEGVIILHLDSGKQEHWKTSPYAPFGVRDNSIHTIFEDLHGNIWLGTGWKGGIHVYSPITENFEHFIIHEGRGTQNRNIINDFEFLKSGECLVAGRGGVASFNVENESLSNIHVSFPGSEASLNIRAVEYDDENNVIWIGTDGQGLMSYSRTDKKIAYYVQRNSENSLPNNAIYDLLYNDSGLWICTWGGGLTKFDPQTKTFHNFSSDTSLQGNNFTGIEKDSYGNTWISSFGYGLLQFDEKTNELKPLNYEGCEKYKKLYTVYVDRSGNVWGCSSNSGLVKYSPQTKSAQFFNQETGYDFNQISSIVQDLKGNFWVATRGRICKLSEEGKFIECFGKEYGIRQVSFSLDAAKCDKNGFLYFGTSKGFLRFHPDKIVKDSLYSENRIISIENFGKERYSRVEIMPSDIENAQCFKYDNNAFTFEFSSMFYSSANSVRFMVRLSGFEKKWRELPLGDRSVTYTNLPSGKYMFEVKSHHPVEFWNAKPARYEFIVDKPFWEQLWFFAAVILLVISALYIIIKARSKRLARDQKELEVLVKERAEKLKRQSLKLQEKITDLDNKKKILRNNNKYITEQRYEINKQKKKLLTQGEKISRQTKHITDSIQYAKNIQDALLHTRKQFKEVFPSSFIFFRPKYIVSGDFYWIRKRNSRMYFICADCTGQGVHGAFMSVLCCTLLNEMFDKYADLHATEIIRLLNNKLYDSLRKHDNDLSETDGVEISVLIFDSQLNSLQFSGSGQPLIVKKQSEATVDLYQPDNFILGQNNILNDVKEFNIEYSFGDIFYVFTDGFVAQRGGLKLERYGLNKFIADLNSINKLSLGSQAIFLESTIDSWVEDATPGHNEQNDDIIVVGLRADANLTSGVLVTKEAENAV